MEKQFTVDSCVGLPSSREWSQTSTFLLSNNNKAGLIVSLRILEVAELLDLAMIGLKIIDEIHNEINTNIEQTSQEWKNYFEKSIEGVGKGVEVNIGIFVANLAETKIIRMGNIEVFVIRNGTDTILLKPGLETAVIRGKILERDALIILTNKLSLQLDKQIDDLQIKSKLDQIIRQSEDSSGMAGLIVAINEDREVGEIFVGERKKSKIYPIIGMGLLGILLLITGFGMWKRSIIGSDQLFFETKTLVEDKKRVIEGIVELDPVGAKAQLNQLKLNVDEYEKHAKGKYLANILEMRKDLDVFEVQILNKSNVNLTTWVELSLLNLNKMPRQIVIGNQAVMYFGTSDGLVGLSITDKSQVKISANGLANYGDFVVDGVNIFALGQDGIYGKINSGNIEFKKMIEADEAWQNPSRMISFGSNLYVLDSSTGEISKYNVNNNEIGARKRWFGKGILLDLSKIVDLVVDGDLWLLSSSGKLERYSRGAPIRWEMEGFTNNNNEVKFVDPAAVATSEQEVFVLERGKNRVVAFDKEGKYVRQYLNEGFGIGKDLVVFEGRGYVLTDNEIKVFGL
ncbi:MAG: hypothetical protein WCL07_02925 [bacterium]